MHPQEGGDCLQVIKMPVMLYALPTTIPGQPPLTLQHIFQCQRFEIGWSGEMDSISLACFQFQELGLDQKQRMI